jgi:hypothetical protein
MLLAMFDLLIIRREARLAQRLLREKLGVNSSLSQSDSGK